MPPDTYPFILLVPELGFRNRGDIVYCAGGVIPPITIAHFDQNGSDLTFNRTQEVKPGKKGLKYYDSCNGDSGGPFWTWVEKDDGTMVAVLIGATNAGSAVCGLGPGMYTNLLSDYAQNWLKQELGEGFRNEALNKGSSLSKSLLIFIGLALKFVI